MIREPFYRAVVERLSGRIAPDLFEQCAAYLVRDELPTLAPVRGGADAGLDGAVADGMGEAYPLICTTSKAVIGNLTRNLDSYVSNGGGRRRAVLATSQDLSARKRRNLSERAKEKGFEPVQIYDQRPSPIASTVIPGGVRGCSA